MLFSLSFLDQSYQGLLFSLVFFFSKELIFSFLLLLFSFFYFLCCSFYNFLKWMLKSLTLFPYFQMYYTFKAVIAASHKFFKFIGDKCYICLVLICISLVSEVEHLFTCLSAVCIYFLWSLFISFAHFSVY